MAGVVSVWFGEVAKFGRPEAARPVGGEVGRRHQGEDGIVEGESGKKGAAVQEKRNSNVLSDSEAVVCMLMDRFAPA
uniref:Uncharacterized protein n=1 Tax=Arundo donax TaxID=35708 RepID=A0A0A9A9S6_ARUDO